MDLELDKPMCPDGKGGFLSIREMRALPPKEASVAMGRLMTMLKSAAKKPKRVAISGGQFKQVDDSEIDFEIDSPNKFFGSHINLIPLQSAVAGPRLFYGARFYNQALPVVKPEAPLVQARADDDPDGKSFDELLGMKAGAHWAADDGVVEEVTPDFIKWKTSQGEARTTHLYNNFPFNRKTAIHNQPLVKPGDAVKRGQLMARSNFTDDTGTLALGLNARIGLVPYLGRSMDDAVVVSESFAKRLTSDHLYGHDLDYKRGVKGGKAHHIGFFPQKFIKAQLDKLDDDGVITPGTVINPGDPIVLATAPRIISSGSAQLGRLSKHMKNARTDASILWDQNVPGEVVDVQKLRNGVKVNIRSFMPSDVGDKIVLRSGQKGTISHIIPDEHMPRTVDGKPLEMLLNPLGIPSRVNDSLPYELLLGKVARKLGRPYKLPTFNGPNDKWYDLVERELAANGLQSREEVFDPRYNRKLENPITVGDGYVLKLHHTSASKISARGQGAYSSDHMPLHGGGDMAKSKRMSGLESHALLSAGAYGVLKDSATVRGTRNDEYWRMLRMGYEPKAPGTPFVYEKFKALLTGSGYHAKKLGGGRERLTFFTDRDLDQHEPIEIRTGDLVDLGSMDPVSGGLFDDALTGANKWGYIKLPFPVPNPAAEDVVRKLLGLTEKQYRAVLAGDMELPPETLARLVQ